VLQLCVVEHCCVVVEVQHVGAVLVCEHEQAVLLFSYCAALFSQSE
jgi:hypothetical protein